ncbi:hypothetical protein LJR220_001160 [Bradyrhizobium sp. LjRoot220]|uniref:hypothetical protein n=1 Tax=Bradyrhizobium sp. LjRoot220 TaxID=3342284 RepID=UPI003ED154E2
MAKSILAADKFVYVADNTAAKLKIDPDDDTGDVEVFERIIPFDATGSNLPDFDKVPGVFPPNESGEHSVNSIPPGSLYQALAFRRGNISDGSSPQEDDFPLAVGRVELPSIFVEARESLLTSCAGVPQLKLSQDSNALRAALATGGEVTRMLLLVGNKKPRLFDTGQGPVPRFGASGSVPVALGSSRVAARLHRVDAPSNTSFSQIDEITPGDSFWFIALVWTARGHWDFAWSIENASEPLEQTALMRTIKAKVLQLTCVNDDSFDDPIFTLKLEDRGTQSIESSSFRWDDMATGKMISPGLSLEWSTDGSEPIFISIGAPDRNYGAEVLLPFPVGDGAHFNERQIRITGKDGLGTQPVFYADVKLTVSYK